LEAGAFRAFPRDWTGYVHAINSYRQMMQSPHSYHLQKKWVDLIFVESRDFVALAWAVM
jgi:hypothetical protein